MGSSLHPAKRAAESSFRKRVKGEVRIAGDS